MKALVALLLFAATPLFASEIADSVVLMYRQSNSGGMEAVCTATAFVPDHGYKASGKNQLFLSAAHCVSKETDDHKIVLSDTPIFLSNDAQDVKTFARATVVVAGKLEEGYDFSVLEADLPGPTLKLGDEHQAKGGDDVISIGAPAGLGKCYFRGYISVLRIDRPLTFTEPPIKWGGAMLLALPAEGGSSGSAIILTKTGDIIGILVGGDKTVTVAWPISKLFSPDKKYLRSPTP